MRFKVEVVLVKGVLAVEVVVPISILLDLFMHQVFWLTNRVMKQKMQPLWFGFIQEK